MLSKIFITFFKIGLFTVGGGYAMLPVIQREVVENKGWLTNDEFTDSIAVTNSLPGPLATNCATFIGYRVAGIWGALVAMLGAILPSFIIIVMIAALFGAFADNTAIENFFAGVRPAVISLIIFAILKLYKNVGVNIVNISFSLIAIVLTLVISLHPVFIVIMFGVIGFFFLRKEANKNDAA
ncbi:MAG: chromate transporter [Bacillota bacterium]